MILYLFHSRGHVVLSLYGKGGFCSRRVRKNSLGDEMVSILSGLLSDQGLNIWDIGKIYLRMSPSSLNASRLLTLMAKTISSFGHKPLFVLRCDGEVEDEGAHLTEFSNMMGLFEPVADAVTLETIYGPWPITNT